MKNGQSIVKQTIDSRIWHKVGNNHHYTRVVLSHQSLPTQQRHLTRQRTEQEDFCVSDLFRQIDALHLRIAQTRFS